MINVVEEAIERFYKKKDYAAFKELSSQQIDLFDELKSYIQEHKLVIDEKPDRLSPSREWSIRFKDPKRGEFEVAYTTVLKISKVAPLFYVEHRFSVKNKDPKGTMPYLTGFAGKGLVMRMWDLHDEITKVLKEKGYSEIDYTEFIQVPDWFVMPEEKKDLGPNVTVEHLLFMDVFDLCLKV